jgi:hypothetical protein
MSARKTNKINKILDEVLGRRWQFKEEDMPTEERQLVYDVLSDYYSSDKERMFVTDSLKHLVESGILTLFDLFSLIGAVDSLKDK